MTLFPFSPTSRSASSTPNGDQIVNGLNVPVRHSRRQPGASGHRPTFSRIALYPMEIERVVVTNTIAHQNFGDLIGTLTLNGDRPDGDHAEQPRFLGQSAAGTLHDCL